MYKWSEGWADEIDLDMLVFLSVCLSANSFYNLRNVCIWRIVFSLFSFTVPYSCLNLISLRKIKMFFLQLSIKLMYRWHIAATRKNTSVVILWHGVGSNMIGNELMARTREAQVSGGEYELRQKGCVALNAQVLICNYFFFCFDSASARNKNASHIGHQSPLQKC